MRSPRPLAAWMVVLATLASVPLAGCYTVEYRKQPSFSAALGEEVPEREVRPDGTVVIYDTKKATSGMKPVSPDAKPMRLREEAVDGTITLRAWLPQDVLANFLACVRDEEYELLAALARSA